MAPQAGCPSLCRAGLDPGIYREKAISFGSVPRAVFMVMHSDFDLDARLRDQEFAGKGCN